MNPWPLQDEDSIIEFYGDPGDNQVRVILPYRHIIAWDKSKTIGSFYCHVKVRDSLCRVLTAVKKEYGLEEIHRLGLDLWGGCLNVRPMTGSRRLSMHSWGIALDYDPERNQYRWGHDKATFAQIEYDPWWKIWEDEGWVSLGREIDKDWMHVQAARLG